MNDIHSTILHTHNVNVECFRNFAINVEHSHSTLLCFHRNFANRTKKKQKKNPENKRKTKSLFSKKPN